MVRWCGDIKIGNAFDGRKFALLQDKCQQDQRWIYMMHYFIEHEGLVLYT